MENTVTIVKPETTLTGTVRIPSSKSISNRLLILRYLSQKSVRIFNLSTANDTVLLDRILKNIDIKDPRRVVINTYNSGTVMRFLTAMLSITKGKYILTGSRRMMERPVYPLVEALIQLGAEISYIKEPGYPPLEIDGKSLAGGTVTIDPGLSSQFVTALMLIAPVMARGLKIMFTKPPVSGSYILMTKKLLEAFGVETLFDNNSIFIAGQHITGQDMTVEKDWSSAACWYEMVALSKNARLLISDLKQSDIQGDAVLPALYEKMGVHTQFTGEGVILTNMKPCSGELNMDLTHHPDLAPYVVVTCAALHIPAVITGLQHLTIKESDRLTALQKELTLIGYNVQCQNGRSLVIRPSGDDSSGVMNTYHDHRLVMAFAALSVKYGMITLNNPGTVSKSYPEFWDQMENCGFILN